ncbi:hypothetical protein DLAC_03265 [Tieghemostelium lacteum]|uniref:Uncharacterized protein n=1 Tax=Tieghemostelium lacteum TaxID=361077 RepID=A0A152A1L3_TIELA|nr:hypothetical protein DLAC_03265 [Tieghemostelium lacteum]|eukprot:KYR00116.1 hypothetical protein DLAC_03265 [Tieghemostelium lacteum]
MINKIIAEQSLTKLYIWHTKPRIMNLSEELPNLLKSKDTLVNLLFPDSLEISGLSMLNQFSNLNFLHLCNSSVDLLDYISNPLCRLQQLTLSKFNELQKLFETLKPNSSITCLVLDNCPMVFSMFIQFINSNKSLLKLICKNAQFTFDIEMDSAKITNQKLEGLLVKNDDEPSAYCHAFNNLWTVPSSLTALELWQDYTKPLNPDLFKRIHSIGYNYLNRNLDPKNVCDLIQTNKSIFDVFKIYGDFTDNDGSDNGEADDIAENERFVMPIFKTILENSVKLCKLEITISLDFNVTVYIIKNIPSTLNTLTLSAAGNYSYPTLFECLMLPVCNNIESLNYYLDKLSSNDTLDGYIELFCDLINNNQNLKRLYISYPHKGTITPETASKFKTTIDNNYTHLFNIGITLYDGNNSENFEFLRKYKL